MSAAHSNSGEVKAMLAEMVEETEDYASVADRAVTDVAAVWLTPQYMLSLRHQLADQPEGPRRFKLLRLA